MKWCKIVSSWVVIFAAILIIRGESFQNSAAYVPPLLPLSPFPEVTGEELREYAMDVVNILGEATLPTRTDELLAIFVSEATAGFTGGLASRLVASLIGDTKRDGGFLKGTTTGTYFGVRAAAKSASLLLGFSPPVATLIADIAGSVVAESAKVIGRKSAEDRDFTLNEWMRGDITDVDESSLETIGLESSSEVAGNFSFNASTASPQPASLSPSPSLTISLAEVIQDVTKWVAYDLLLPSDMSDQVPFLVAMQYGALSGLAGNAVFELLKATTAAEEEEGAATAGPVDTHYHLKSSSSSSNNTYTDTKTDKEKFQRSVRSFRKISARFMRAGLEGGALFASYEGTVNFFDSNKSLPPAVQAFFTTKFSDLADDLKRLVSPT